MPMMLLVVGMQKDKVDAMGRGGEQSTAKHVPMGRHGTIRRDVNQCIDFAMKNGWCVTFAMDMHHKGHSSFYNNGGTLRDHCVVGTMGCDPIYGLRYGEMGMDTVYRGTEMDGDSSDAFWDIEKKCGSRLHELLSKAKGLVVCGTSPDGCIENTLSTALERGFPVHIVADAVWLLDEMPKGVGVLNLSSMDSC